LTDQVAAPADPFTSSLAGRRLGRYEVLARLASGGMAGVYVARALGVAGFERLFAIKVLHPHLAHEEEFITMFLDEARLAARIRHPNVVPTIDISDTQDAGYFLVMDYIEGDHLGALLQAAYKRGERLPSPVTLRVVVDALDGLAAAHELTDETGRRINLVHRDVSPHNIMVSTDGIARLTDFGVAKAEVRLSTTQEGQFKGKLAYMAPEHASNGEADQRSDLFSMGIILWECLTGRRLFRAENHAATLNKICIEPIPMPSSVDPELAPFDHVLEKALARDPNDRFQSAEEFAMAIEAAAATLGGLANQRAVAKLVQDYAAEKIARDMELVRTAIADMGAAPMPDVSAPPAPAGAIQPAPPAAAEASPSLPASMAAPPMEPRRNWPLVALGLLAVIAIGLGVAALMMQGDEVTASPLAEPPSTAADEPSATAAADEEPPAADPEAAGTEGEIAAGDETAVDGDPEAVEGEAAAAEAGGPDDEASVEEAAQAAAPAAKPTKKARVKRPRTQTAEKRPKAKKKVDELLLNPYRK
jgi:serine/threonine-protein kinase